MAFPHFLPVCAPVWHRQHSPDDSVFLHNLISQIALPSQIQYITCCCHKGFAGYYGYSGSQECCARGKRRRRSRRRISGRRGCLSQFGCEAQTAIKVQKIKVEINTHTTNSFYSQRSIPCHHMLTTVADYTLHPLQLTPTNDPDFPATGKVTLPCLDWFIKSFKLPLITPLTFDLFALGHHTRSYYPQHHSSQGHKDT